MPPADYLIMESTYGGRLHKTRGACGQQAAATWLTARAARGGRIIVPAFAVGRTQQLVLLLHQLRTRSVFRTSRSSWTARSR